MLEYLRLWKRKLDLDAAWVANQEFDYVYDEELDAPEAQGSAAPDWRTCLAWFVPLLKHGLDSDASALHLLGDREGRCLRQLIWIPCNGGKEHYEWIELLPMPWPLLDNGIRAVRMAACMMSWSNQGIIRYRYKGRWAKARCVQESVDDLAIYFTADRPLLRRLTPKVSTTESGNL